MSEMSDADNRNYSMVIFIMQRKFFKKRIAKTEAISYNEKAL